MWLLVLRLVPRTASRWYSTVVLNWNIVVFTLGVRLSHTGLYKFIIKSFFSGIWQFCTVRICNGQKTPTKHRKALKKVTPNLKLRDGYVEAAQGLMPDTRPVLWLSDGTERTPTMAPSARRLRWWKIQIIPVKKQATIQLGALFAHFKDICSLIRYRKQLATCWWEPMEKNTLSINCVFLIPRSHLQGVGIGSSILGTAALR